MRFVSLAVVLLGASPALAGAGSCRVHVHPGAPAYSTIGADDSPVLGVEPGEDRDLVLLDNVTPGGPWVYEGHFFWRRLDVDLVGDCSHVKTGRYVPPKSARPAGMCGPYWRGFKQYYVPCTSR